MKVTLTSIELIGPFKFFILSARAWKIMGQLKASQYRDFLKRGFWATHYTMTLWNNDADLKTFAKSGAHLEAMKKSAEIAKEIRTYTYEAESLPTWKEAFSLLEKGKVIRFE